MTWDPSQGSSNERGALAPLPFPSLSTAWLILVHMGQKDVKGEQVAQTKEGPSLPPSRWSVTQQPARQPPPGASGKPRKRMACKLQDRRHGLIPHRPGVYWLTGRRGESQGGNCSNTPRLTFPSLLFKKRKSQGFNLDGHQQKQMDSFLIYLLNLMLLRLL